MLRGAGKFTTVAERLRPQSLYDRFVAFRESLGMEVLPHSGGASRFGVLARRLRAGGLVCLLCERDLTESGIEVSVFGEPARMMGGPAALAVHIGAALMPVTLWYDGPYWCARIHPEIPVPGEGSHGDKTAVMTQRLAASSKRPSRGTQRTGTCCRRCSSRTWTLPGWPSPKAKGPARPARARTTPRGGDSWVGAAPARHGVRGRPADGALPVLAAERGLRPARITTAICGPRCCARPSRRSPKPVPPR